MTRWLSVLPLLAWVGAWALRPLAPNLVQYIDESATVSLVSSDVRGNVVSNVAGLVIVVVWAIACALLVEPAKFHARAHFGRHGNVGYFVLLTYQVVLVTETVRVQLPDWWIWCKRLLHLRLFTGVGDPLMVAQAAFPWVSLLSALAVAAAWWFGQRREQADRSC